VRLHPFVTRRGDVVADDFSWITMTGRIDEQHPLGVADHLRSFREQLVGSNNSNFLDVFERQFPGCQPACGVIRPKRITETDDEQSRHSARD